MQADSNHPYSKSELTAHLPGEDETMWLFIMGDMIVFTLFFCMYAYYRNGDLALFQQSQQTLDINIGTINTLLLLTSSWLVALALKVARLGQTANCRWLLLAAAIFGSGFAIMKVVEYQAKAEAGIHFLSNDFYLFYYLLTGIHFAHLVVGLCVLFYFVFIYRTEALSTDQINTLELGGVYWHMVDLLWIIIFPLLYLIP